MWIAFFFPIQNKKTPLFTPHQIFFLPLSFPLFLLSSLTKKNQEKEKNKIPLRGGVSTDGDVGWRDQPSTWRGPQGGGAPAHDPLSPAPQPPLSPAAQGYHPHDFARIDNRSLLSAEMDPASTFNRSIEAGTPTALNHSRIEDPLVDSQFHQAHSTPIRRINPPPQTPPTQAVPQPVPAPAATNSRENINDAYNNMSDDQVKKKMKWIVYIWAYTNLFGSFAMPSWIAIFAMQWYTAVILVPGEVAMVVTLSKCIDVLTDPLVACYLRKCTMHTISRIAVLGSIVQGIAFAGIFIPFRPIDPAGDRTRVLAQYAGCYVLFYMGDTLQGTPITTLGTMLKSQRILDEPHHNDGLRMGSMMKVLGIFFMGIVTYIIGAVMRKLDAEMGPEDGVLSGLLPYTNLIVACFVALLHVLINLIFANILRGYKDSTVSPAILERMKRTSFLQQFSEMMTSSYNNPFFRQLIGAWMCDQLTITLAKNLLMWFVRHKISPEMSKGCQAYEDEVNKEYRDEGGFESGFAKVDFECKAINVASLAVAFIIMGAVAGNVFWQKKIDREKDRYGNRTLYANWLLFNLSSALTNGLLVFVGRGDTRLFWFLCFVNGLPFGGEFMTDTILLFLIGSEAWLSRSDEPLTQMQEAENLDAHTTKFSMMKTFIPKIVSLVAEALPLALIQIWYKEPRDICIERTTNGLPDPILDINSQECAKFLSYPETGNPKFIPQKPQVSELISFFFFILPTITSLLSYYIKSKFQVTDTGELTMLSSLRKGVPQTDQPGAGRYTPNPLSSSQQQQPAPTVNITDKLTRLGVEQIHRSVTDFLGRHKHGGLPSMTGSSPQYPSEATYKASLDKDAIDSLIHQLQSACEINPEEAVAPNGNALTSAQSLSSITLPKPIIDEWVGNIIPTTHGQHMFKLPYAAHPLALVPISLLRFATTQNVHAPACDSLMSSFKHTIYDQRSTAVIKGLIHGSFAIIIVPLWLVYTILSTFVVGLIYFLRRLVPGLREEWSGRYGPDLHLFGIAGKRSIQSYTDRVLPVLAAHVIAPGDQSQAGLIRNTVLCWLNTARSRGPLVEGHAQREQRLSNKGSEGVVFPTKSLYLESRLLVRIVYLRVLGYSFMVSMLCIIIAIFLKYGSSVFRSKWSIGVTVPLFLSSIGLVTGLFYSGLLSQSRGSNPTFRADRVLDAEGLATIAVCQYNTQNRAGGNPLVFSTTVPDDAAQRTFLYGLDASVKLNRVPLPNSPPPSDQNLSYVMFVPGSSVNAALKLLDPVHRVLDQVETEANRRRSAVGQPANVRWSVGNIMPPDRYPYRCFLYTWEGVAAPFVTTHSGADRTKSD